MIGTQAPIPSDRANHVAERDCGCALLDYHNLLTHLRRIPREIDSAPGSSRLCTTESSLTHLYQLINYPKEGHGSCTPFQKRRRLDHRFKLPSLIVLLVNISYYFYSQRHWLFKVRHDAVAFTYKTVTYLSLLFLKLGVLPAHLSIWLKKTT